MLLLIDKPTWLTSQDAISAVKKHLREPARDALSLEDREAGLKPPKIKIWHSGTLDPMASWLLIAATDKDTKQLYHLTGLDKSYIATINFSIITDTWDMDFWKEFKQLEMVEQIHAPTLSQLQHKLDSIIGTHDLPLTPFSAKKINGRKLYEYAREWKAIFLTVPMTVYGYEILDYQFPLLTCRLDVASGAYIRSIAHRLGRQFDIWWTLTMLRRIIIGEYSIEHIKNPKLATWDEKGIFYSVIQNGIYDK